MERNDGILNFRVACVTDRIIILSLIILLIFFSGENAIWLDNELYRGRSGASETFGNEQLTESPDFLCTRVEVLGFVTES